MKIEKGHYVPKELITSEAIHEAVVKCFVAAGFEKPVTSGFGDSTGVGAGTIACKIELGGIPCSFPITLQQLFTASNGLVWPDWAESIKSDNYAVWFASAGGGVVQFIAGNSFSAEFDILATRAQPEQVDKRKLIDEAVHQNKGVWPRKGGGNYLKVAGPKNISHTPFAAFDFGCYENGSNDYWVCLCERHEFESRASELGYINGYRYGVEYPTDGKRPDLPTKLEIEWFYSHGSYRTTVGRLNWDGSVASFKITDDRYKPEDTSYLLKPEPVPKTAESKEEIASDWWDYEADNYISTCPIGAAVVVICDELSPLSEFGETFLDQECVVKSTFKNKHDFNMVSVEKADGECCCFVLRLIKPLDHATRKAEMDRKALIKEAASIVGSLNSHTALYTIETLIKAGWRPIK